MSRTALALAGVVLLAGAAALHPAPAPAAGPLAALGRSLGGWRVAAVDVLALRADALRREGRSDELVAVYEAMVGLDPGNAAATEALAALLVAEGLRVASSDDERLERWSDGMRLLQAGIVEHPSSALLAMRAGLLLLEDAEATPGLAQRVEARMGGVGGRVGTGLAFLAAAAAAEEHLPRTGRAHLVALAREAPRRAAEALVRGAPGAEVRALLAEAAVLGALRSAACAQVEELTDPEPGHPEGRRVALPERLAAHAALLEAALAARAAHDSAALARALEAAEARAGATATTRALRATLPR
ncbi:MAG: hypothetical protein ACKOSS_10640 [Planctomycetia bacterium]